MPPWYLVVNCPILFQSIYSLLHLFFENCYVVFKLRHGKSTIYLYFSGARKTNQKQPPGVLCEKCVLKKSAKFTGKHLCQSLFFSKVAGLRAATLLKKRLWRRCLPVNFVKILRTRFSLNTSGGCLLRVEIEV